MVLAQLLTVESRTLGWELEVGLPVGLKAVGPHCRWKGVVAPSPWLFSDVNGNEVPWEVRRGQAFRPCGLLSVT